MPIKGIFKELGFEAGAYEEERRLLSEIKSTGTSQAAALGVDDTTML